MAAFHQFRRSSLYILAVLVLLLAAQAALAGPLCPSLPGAQAAAMTGCARMVSPPPLGGACCDRAAERVDCVSAAWDMAPAKAADATPIEAAAPISTPGLVLPAASAARTPALAAPREAAPPIPAAILFRRFIS
ncbi:MAG: hypothetical protein ACOZDY_21065 [Pseudomonadota bacterium]